MRVRDEVEREMTALADRTEVVVPTSGSTGEPKLAVLPRAALLASASATLDRLGGPGQWLLALPTERIAGVQVLIRSALAGTVPVTLESDQSFTVERFAAGTRMLDSTRRYTALVPTQLHRLLDGPTGIASLQTYDAVLVGGDALSSLDRRRAVEVGIKIISTYGMTETCGGCVYDGIPLDGVQLHVSDGEPIRIGGPMVFTSYLDRPDLTAAALEVDHAGTRWHLTRDLGHVVDGKLTIDGRIDDIIITGGHKVAPAVVARVIGEHPAVDDVVVSGRVDPEWGARVVATVTVRTGSDMTADELRSWCEGRLPVYAVPRTFDILAPRGR